MFFNHDEDDFVQKPYLDANPNIIDKMRTRAAERITSYYNWDRIAGPYLVLLNAFEKGRK